MLLGSDNVQSVTSLAMTAGEEATPPPPSSPFAVDANSIDPAVFGLTTYITAATTVSAAKIDRKSALQVPAVKRAHDLICGTLGGIPLERVTRDGTVVDSPLFAQPEANVPRSVTMTRTFADLLFEAVAWWRITERDYRGYPTKVKRLDPDAVTVNGDRVYVDGLPVPDRDLIRFDSPLPGLLTAGARAIRTCLALDVAAANAADGVPPLEFFTPTDGVDIGDKDYITEVMDGWQDARRKRSAAYVPAALTRHEGGWNPEQLQLAEARQHAVLELSRLTNIDAEEMGVSTTSRTYANQYDRRKAFIDFTLGPFRNAAEDRFSMGDVTTLGDRGVFDLSTFLRSDDAARWAGYKTGLEVGAIDHEYINRREGNNVAEPPAKPTANVRAITSRESA